MHTATFWAVSLMHVDLHVVHATHRDQHSRQQRKSTFTRTAARADAAGQIRVSCFNFKFKFDGGRFAPLKTARSLGRLPCCGVINKPHLYLVFTSNAEALDSLLASVAFLHLTTGEPHLIVLVFLMCRPHDLLNLYCQLRPTGHGM